MGSIFLQITSLLSKATSLTFFTSILRCENIHLFFHDATKLFSLLMWYDSHRHFGCAFFAGSYLSVLSVHCTLKFVLTQFNRIQCFCDAVIQSLA